MSLKLKRKKSDVIKPAGKRLRFV